MQLVTFVFGNNLDSRTVEVKGSSMRNASHWAAKRLGIKECNLVFIRIVEIQKAA